MSINIETPKLLRLLKIAKELRLDIASMPVEFQHAFPNHDTLAEFRKAIDEIIADESAQAGSEIYKEGWNASWDEKGENACPYSPRGCFAAQTWLDGYYDEQSKHRGIWSKNVGTKL